MDPSRAQLIASISAAVEASPSDPVLRLHLAELLLDAGDTTAAIPHIATSLQQDPQSEQAKALMGRALGTPPAAPAAPADQPGPPAPTAAAPPAAPAAPPVPPAAPAAPPGPAGGPERHGAPGQAAPGPVRPPAAPAPPASVAPVRPEAEEDAGAEPAAGPGFGFAGAGRGGTALLERDGDRKDREEPRRDPGAAPWPDGAAPPLAADDFPPEPARTTLADVAGMDKVKDRINAAFLMPMRNERLRKAYAKSLRGGLLLYGPPGCGKTFMAKAVAGEIGARFLSASVADIADTRMGRAEQNIQALFRQARQYRPAVVFLDELDALGGRRGNTAAMLRPLVTQLLTELDSVEDDNDGVFFLAATNHPWDIDSALKRPGRLDRMLFVPPPDREARAALVASAMTDRPGAGIDPGKIAKHTEGFSGADLTHLVDSAAERAMLDSARTGTVRPITMDDFQAVLAEVRPSTGPWLETARNVVEFSGDSAYDELGAYLRAQRRTRR
ncbi:ATP-binding protein [Nocardiopsis composta]|uniref:AAA+ superfamily predicted ATPase n=1 Tax=Nocardiopsis composta TaxID=157465 RepID=A0A7W8VF85_9ACTN|nr:ATP-binding protein [Nocardiopsis composta]MBB5434157.1 AAA+ superfamily predicted ATPase [Nocardiopsis composta]